MRVLPVVLAAALVALLILLSGDGAPELPPPASPAERPAEEEPRAPGPGPGRPEPPAEEPEGRAVVVTVLDRETEEPIEGALVAVGPVVRKEDGGLLHDARGAHTGTDGSARVAGLPDGRLLVSASHEDYLELDTLLPFAEPAVVRLRRGLPIAGTVLLPHGAALREGVVRFDGRTAEIDGRGRFRFPALEPGTYPLVVHAESGGQRLSATAVAEAGDEDVKLRLTPARRWPPEATVILRVEDPRGRPVREGKLLWIETFSRFGTSTTEAALAGGSARYLKLDGKETLRAWVHGARDRDGRLLGCALSDPLDRGEDSPNVLRLPEPLTISGVVRTPGGDPVAGAAVHLRPVLDRLVPLLPGSATSAGGGTFVLDGVGPGRYEIEAAPPGGYPAGEPTAAEAGATGVVVVLPRDPVLTVVDYDGRPVAGALVIPVRMAEDAGYHESVGLTNGAGERPIGGLATGARYDVTIRPPDDRPDLQPAEIERWDRTSRRVVLPRSFFVRGVVVDTEGRRVPTALVWTFDPETEGYSGTSVDAEGRFTVRNLPEGRVRLWASPDSGGTMDRDRFTDARTGDEGVVLKVPAGDRLTIRVENWSMERLLEIVTVRLATAGRAPETIREGGPDRDGRVRFAALPSGERFAAFVFAESDGHCGYREGVRADGGEVLVRLSPPKRITGRLLVPEGSTGLRVELRAPALHRQGVVAADGRFEIAGLPAGRFRLTARAGHEGRTLCGEATAEAGADVDIPLTVR